MLSKHWLCRDRETAKCSNIRRWNWYSDLYAPAHYSPCTVLRTGMGRLNERLSHNPRSPNIASRWHGICTVPRRVSWTLHVSRYHPASEIFSSPGWRAWRWLIGLFFVSRSNDFDCRPMHLMVLSCSCGPWEMRIPRFHTSTWWWHEASSSVPSVVLSHSSFQSFFCRWRLC